MIGLRLRGITKCVQDSYCSSSSSSSSKFIDKIIYRVKNAHEKHLISSSPFQESVFLQYSAICAFIEVFTLKKFIYWLRMNIITVSKMG